MYITPFVNCKLCRLTWRHKIRRRLGWTRYRLAKMFWCRWLYRLGAHHLIFRGVGGWKFESGKVVFFTPQPDELFFLDLLRHRRPRSFYISMDSLQLSWAGQVVFNSSTRGKLSFHGSMPSPLKMVRPLSMMILRIVRLEVIWCFGRGHLSVLVLYTLFICSDCARA